MRYNALLFILIMTCSSLSGFGKLNPDVTGDRKAKKTALPQLEIYLLIGQSNMAGRAEIEVIDKDSLENVFLFTGIAGREWERAANPLNKYSTVRKALPMQKMGPGYYFAKTIAAERPHKAIGLVVNAKGGTSIGEWMPGEKLYTEAVNRAKAAMKSGKLKGIVWHQGESDVAQCDTYRDKITLLIRSLRKDLGDAKLPFVAGELSEDQPSRIAFNQVIVKLPGSVKFTGVALSDGTTTIDHTHFNSASQRLIGERFGKEMLKLIK